VNILFLAPQPFMEKRGTPLAVFQVLKALGELGHSIDLVTYHLGEDRRIEGVKHFRTPSFPFIKKVKKGQSLAKVFLDVFVFIKALNLLKKNSYDCIHAVEEAATMGIFLKGFYNKPLIYDMDSSMPDQLRDSTSPFWSNGALLRLVGFFEKKTIGHADLVLAVCKALMEKVHLVFPDKPVVLLEDIPNVEPFDPSMKDKVEHLKTQLGLTKNKVILYTGTFESYQGIDLLLASVANIVTDFPRVKLVLVGGDGDQVGEKSSIVKSMGIERNVLILGKRPLEEMPLFMEMADLLVSPRNKGTNTPMKIYTYLQSGKPVVATRMLTHTQVLTDDVAILVNADHKSFSRGIMRVLKDSELGERIGRAGKKLVQENYSYGSFKKKVEKAYGLIKK